MVGVRVRQNDADQLRVGTVKPGDRRERQRSGDVGIEGQAEVDDHPEALMLELDTTAADRLAPAMDADPHLGAPGACFAAAKAVSPCRPDRPVAASGTRLSTWLYR